MEKKSKFLVAGLVTSTEFQRSRYYVERVYKSCPNKYAKPDIRAFLNVAWYEYLTKTRRKIGGRIWSLKKNCVVFLDDDYIGDDDDLFKYMLIYTRIRITVDFNTLGVNHLKEILANDISNGCNNIGLKALLMATIGEFRRAYGTENVTSSRETVSAPENYVKLYEELVPQTTNMFLRRCKSRRNGWVNRKIHRIVKDCWLQGGGFDLKHKRIPCENYIIPHDRRGVLSMCNNGKHTDNSVQYIISLNPTPWMDHKYVAFGQLIQGEEILRKIEAVETRYESPVRDITVILCGEYHVDFEIDPRDVEMVSKYFKNLEERGLPKDITAPFDVESDLSVSRYQEGDYCFESDLKSNLHLMQLPSFLVQRFMEYTCTSALIDDEEGTPEISYEKLVPVTMDMNYQASIKLVKSRHIDDEEVNEKEVIQKVVEFDKIMAVPKPVRITSSEQMHHEEVKNLYLY